MSVASYLSLKQGALGGPWSRQMMEKVLAEFTGSIVKLFTASGGRAYVGLLAELGEDYVLLKDQTGGADSYIAIHTIEAVIPLPRDYLDAPSP
ncbi:MAG TPA: hypothetical protein VJ718_07195 [Candidatus Binataceae bacterium]|nr:hypothetical protein [Candidatus Binataceae bacterium]